MWLLVINLTRLVNLDRHAAVSEKLQKRQALAPQFLERFFKGNFHGEY